MGYAHAVGTPTILLAEHPREGQGKLPFDISGFRCIFYDDAIRGDADRNILEGAGGRDVLDGRAGADTVQGGFPQVVYLDFDSATGRGETKTVGDTVTSTRSSPTRANRL